MITMENAVKYILQTDSDFRVRFLKRTDGSIREMHCTRNLPVPSKGGVLAFDPKQHKLIHVWDFSKMDYRFIPADSILAVEIDGIWYLTSEG